MISLPYQRKLMKVGSSSTALVLDKDWVDRLKATLGKNEVTINVFGEDFLVLEVVGLKIKDAETKELLDSIKEFLSKKKKVE